MPGFAATPRTLREAIMTGDAAAVRAFAAFPGAVRRDWNGEGFPLNGAAGRGDVGFVEELLTAGAAVGGNSRQTALHSAAGNGRTEFVQLLLRRGASGVALDKDDETPFHKAVREGHTGAAAAVLSVSEAVYCRKCRWTAAHMAACRRDSRDLPRLSLGKGGVDARDSFRRTALHYVASSGSASAFGVVLKAGTDPRARNGEGRRPLHLRP
jgi:cytohesin